MQLLEHISHQVEREHCAKKRERFANLIVLSWVTADPVAGIMDEAMLFSDAASHFTDAHVALLHLLYEDQTGRLSFQDLAKLIQVESDAEREELALIVLFDLCSRFAFVRRAKGLNEPREEKPKLLTSRNLSPEGIARGCSHEITDRGRRFVDGVIRGISAANSTGEIQ